MIIEKGKYRMFNQDTELGEEEYQIKKINQILAVESKVVLFSNGRRTKVSSTLIFDELWIPLKATIEVGERETVTEIECYGDYSRITIHTKQNENSFRVSIERDEIIFLFPGAISLPYLWVRNLKNITTKKNIFQCASTGTIAQVK